MKKRDRSSSSGPLTPAVYCILLALSDGEKHGYAVMQEVNETTQGAVKMGPGTLYGSLDRMMQAGLVEEVRSSQRKTPVDARRTYYRIAPAGIQALISDTERLNRLLKHAQKKQVLRSQFGAAK